MSFNIFLVADHGLSVIYFLQSNLVKSLVESDVEVVILTDSKVKEKIQKRFPVPGVKYESLSLGQVERYMKNVFPVFQYWLNFFRRAGASGKINLEAVKAYVKQVEYEAHESRKNFFPIVKLLITILRNSKIARKLLINLQHFFTPDIYSNLFDQYQPDLVVTSTPGWRKDRYILREAGKRRIPTASVIIGWDNTSSYSLPGAKVDWITCWSEIQKDELINGSDWSPARVNVGGIPSYDGYFLEQWKIPREDYFELHGLKRDRKLISYACSFISFSPNIQNIEALIELITQNQLISPAQLLIRLHPNHFLNDPRFKSEKERIEELSRVHPLVHLVKPIPLGGDLGHYSGEDMEEKSSMMAYSDICVTVYSTMALEASIHGTPVISLCIDSDLGWKDNFSLKLSEIGKWPTHYRFRKSKAGMEVQDIESLKKSLDHFLSKSNMGEKARSDFVKRECTFVDGSSGRRTAEFLLSILEGRSD